MLAFMGHAVKFECTPRGAKGGWKKSAPYFMAQNFDRRCCKMFLFVHRPLESKSSNAPQLGI